MSFQIPKELQEQLTQFEQVKSQLQIVLTQKSEMDARKREILEAVKALEARKEGDVYRRVGDLLIKVEDTDSLLKELKEEEETLGVRITSMENQEKSLKEMYEKMGNEINEALKGYK
jgi:prefoldin beta subunit